jgi:GT2 family glycosyltransferase
MLASVILCTYNRARLLERALSSLSRQTMTPDGFEVIVVDDGSSDGTAAVCEKAGRSLPGFRYIPLARNLGLAAAGNRGIREARGEAFLFIDDDCIADESWAESLAASLERHPLAAGAIRSPLTNPIKLGHNISQFHPFMERREEGWAKSIAGANMGMRRSLFSELGGFNEKSEVPDMELLFRAWEKGYRVRFVPGAVILHDPERVRLAKILAHAARRASLMIPLRQQYGPLLRTPFILRSPDLILLAAPLIALKVTAGIYVNNRGLTRYSWTAPLVFAQKLAWCWGAAQGLRERKLKMPDSVPAAVSGRRARSPLRSG